MVGHDHPVERGDLFALARCHRWTPFGLSFPSMLTDSLPQPVSSCRRRTRRIRRSTPARVERRARRSEEHTSELQSLMRISYAVFCLKKKKTHHHTVNYSIVISM